MTPSYWYLPGTDGRHYSWAKHPTFECPNADAVTYTPPAQEGDEGTWTLDREEIAVAAAAIDADPILLAKLLRQRHQTSAVTGRLRVAGVLTQRCAVCGAKMKRKGFRAWIDAPSEDAASQRVSSRLGFAPPRTTIRTTWHPTRKDAAAWARHERRRAGAAEDDA